MLLMSLKHLYMGFPGGSVVEDPPVNAETEVQFPSWEDPLEGETATHSSILAWKITWTEEPVNGVTKSQTQLSDWACKVCLI